MSRTTRLAAVFILAFAISPALAQRAQDVEGFAPDRLARFRTVYEGEIKSDTTAGVVVLVARNGKIVHYEAYGFQDAAKSVPLRRDAIYRAFSMTKPFVSVATMMLVERGELLLSDPISKWLPEMRELTVMVEKKDADGKVSHETVKAARPIRVYDLLRHTSGFTYAGDAPHAPLREAYRAGGLEWTNFETGEAFLTALARVPLAWQPGTRWEYGLSTDVLGVLLERVTKKPLDVLLDEMIFRPLRMKDTRFTLDAEQEARLADALDKEPEKVKAWKWFRDESRVDKKLRSGGAGAYTTAYDYYRFCQMLLQGGELDGARLLSRKTVEQMFSDQVEGLWPPSPTGSASVIGFGLGFAIRRRDGYGLTPGSGGEAFWNGFGGTSFLIDPKERVVAISMSQGPTAFGRLSLLLRELTWGALVR